LAAVLFDCACLVLYPKRLSSASGSTFSKPTSRPPRLKYSLPPTMGGCACCLIVHVLYSDGEIETRSFQSSALDTDTPRSSVQRALDRGACMPCRASCWPTAAVLSALHGCPLRCLIVHVLYSDGEIETRGFRMQNKTFAPSQCCAATAASLLVIKRFGRQSNSCWIVHVVYSRLSRS
jgi:hypothetical protein